MPFFRSENLTVESERMRGHYPQVGTLLLSLMIQYSRALRVKKKLCSRPVLNSDIVVTCPFLESIANFFLVCVLALKKAILILYLIIFKNI